LGKKSIKNEREGEFLRMERIGGIFLLIFIIYYCIPP
jgi:hypothetical protein